MTSPARRAPALFASSLSMLAALLIWAPDALAAQGAAGAVAAASLVKSASVVGPLGISPFFALAGFGLAASLGVWSLPAGLESFGHPAVWIGLVLLGGLLQFGRSTKLTKPLAETLGAGESLFGLVAAVMVMLPHLASTPAAPVAEASAGSTILAALVIGGVAETVRWAR